jgi:hypothetical protein
MQQQQQASMLAVQLMPGTSCHLLGIQQQQQRW